MINTSMVSFDEKCILKYLLSFRDEDDRFNETNNCETETWIAAIVGWEVEFDHLVKLGLCDEVNHKCDNLKEFRINFDGAKLLSKLSKEELKNLKEPIPRKRNIT